MIIILKKNQLNFKKATLFIFFLYSYFISAQTINGNLFDKENNEPLIGASVYIDGTTIGTISDFEGYFELDLKETKNTQLIVSFLGYETKIFQINSTEIPKKIHLKTNQNQLDVVTIEPDNWSRERKLRIFKSEFLGKSDITKHCKIINEKDITIIYKASNNTLIAYADKPIIIKNKFLGYEIYYNLEDFEIEFSYDIMGLVHPHKIYFTGTSFFSELNKKAKKKITNNRIKVYKGSLTHFMRALSNFELTENDFGIYYKRLPVSPYKYFTINKKDSETEVKILKEKLSVLYNQFDQSSIQFSEGHNYFMIDNLGNHSPPNSLIFRGDFGKKRVSNMLPLNYSPVIK